MESLYATHWYGKTVETRSPSNWMFMLGKLTQEITTLGMKGILMTHYRSKQLIKPGNLPLLFEYSKQLNPK